MFDSDYSYANVSSIDDFMNCEDFSWDDVKKYTTIRLINKQMLSDYDNDIVYKPFLDLYITCALQMKQKDTYMSHMLTSSDLDKLQVSYEDVYKQATKNLNDNIHSRILSLRDFILKDNIFYPLRLNTNTPLATAAEGEDMMFIEDISMSDQDKSNVLVITNVKEPFGANMLCSWKILDKVSKKFNGENFYIIPMSVHSLMCVRNSYATHNGEKEKYEAEDDLLSMNEKINDNIPSWKDILSYKIYYRISDDGNMIFPITKPMKGV